MLTSVQHDTFDRQGFVYLRGAFSATAAAAMEDRLWVLLAEQQNVRRGSPETWPAVFATGLQSLKADPVFKPLGGSVTVSALDDILGSGPWPRPPHWGQCLASFPPRPGAPAPLAKAIWHTDFPFGSPDDRLAGAVVFGFLSEVAGLSGGTAVLEGSHRVVQRYVAAQPRETLASMKRVRKALLGSHPSLAELAAITGPNWLEQYLGRDFEIDGMTVRVGELTGAPGDLVIGHPWLLHAPAPNRTSRPRLMSVKRILVTAAASAH